MSVDSPAGCGRLRPARRLACAPVSRGLASSLFVHSVTAALRYGARGIA